MRRTLSVVLAISIAVGAAALGAGWAGAATGGGGGQADAAGVINFPSDLTGLGGTKFDPIAAASPNDWYWQQFVYDSLLRQNADGCYSPGLAKSATATDPQTIVVELQAEHQVLRRHPARRGRGEVQHRADDRGEERRRRSAPSSTRWRASPSTARRSSRSS